MLRHLALALVLAATPVAVSATEVPVRIAVQHSAQLTEIPNTERVTIPVRAEETRRESDAAVARQPDSTAWWWLVGAVAVGAIVAIVIAA